MAVCLVSVDGLIDMCVLLAQMSWEERLKETEARQREHEAELRAMGVTMGEERAAELELAKTVPHMVNLHEDGSLSEQIHHFFGNGACVIRTSSFRLSS